MSIPTIKCKNCGHEFSLEILQDGNKQWLELDPEHVCPYEDFLDGTGEPPAEEPPILD
jgi:hypothetical protein